MPNPKVVAALDRAASARLAERVTNAVLHDWANAVRNVVPPSDPPSKFLKPWPPTVASAGQPTAVSGRVPAPSSAAVVTTLNVDPGGYWPARARLNGWSNGRLTTARTSPVPASRATRAAGKVTPASACSAASWVRRSSVVPTGWGGVPVNWNRVLTGSSVATSTTRTSPDGVPASRRSKAASSPESPTLSPTT